MRRMVGLAAAVAVLALAGCRADVDANPAGHVEPLVAVFDPANGVVPMPNDILISSGGQVRIPTELVKPDGTTVKAFPPAMEELVATWLNRLDAFPPELPLTVAFSRPGLDPATPDIDAASLTRAIRVFDVTALAEEIEAALAAGSDPSTDPKVQGAVVTEVSDDITAGPVVPVTTATGLPTWQVSFVPKTPWEPGHRYLAFLLTSVRTIGGQSVAPPLAMNFLKAREPLVADPNPSVPGDEYSVVLVPADTQDEMDRAARDLEAIRVALKPFLDWFESESRGVIRVPREQAALAWSFSISSYPRVVFDPASGAIPLPNDLLRDQATGRLAFPLPAGVKCDDPATIAALPDETRVQGEFFCWMNRKDGFQAVSSPAASVTEPPDADTVNPDNAKLYDLSGGTATEVPDVTVKLTGDGRVITLDPKKPLEAGHTYLAVLLNQIGREVGTEDRPVFEPLTPPAAMAMLRLTNPLVKDGKSELPGTLADADAVRLEAIRAALAPALDALETAGYARTDAAGFFTFTVTTSNEALFDPPAGILPFPNDILLDPTTGRVVLPPSPSDPPALAALKVALGSLDGFSTVAPASTSFAMPLDPSSLSLAGSFAELMSAAIAFADVTDVDPTDPTTLDKLVVYGPDRIDATFDEPTGQLVLSPKPGKPLPPKRRFLVVVFDKVRTAVDGGAAVPAIDPSPIFFLARSKNPLVKDGKSTLPGLLSDQDAAALEQLRQGYGPIFDVIGRENVLVLFSFTTASTTDELASLTASLTATPAVWGPDMELQGTGSAAVKSFFGDNPYDKVGEVCLDCALKVNVLLGAPDLTDPANPVLGHFVTGEDGKPAFTPDLKLPFVLVLPAGSPPAGGWPVVLFQHGLHGSRLEVAGIANDLAAAGFATVAVDAPYHGDHPIRIPATEDGTGFFSADVFAVRDNIREVALEHRQVLTFIEKGLDAWLAGKGKPAGTVDGATVRFLGASLGGITGAVSMAVNASVEKVALVTAGGHLTRIFMETQNSGFRDPLVQALAAMQIVPGTPEFNLFLVIAQWVLDRADPVNYAALAGDGGVKPSERILMVGARGDEYIPNTTTDELKDAFGAADGTPPELTYYPDDGSADKVCHDFFVGGCDEATWPKAAAARAAARAAVLDFLGE